MSDFTATRPYSYTALTLIDQNQNNPNETTIYGKFNGAIHATTGHTHTGATGDGPVIPIAGGGTGAITAPLARTALGLNSQLGWFRNISITRVTTTNAGDSVKITSGDGTALSSTNYGTVFLPSTVTAGLTVEFTVTADVTILLTGAHWGIGTTGDITGALLRVLAINDNGTLRWGVAYLGGRTTLLTTDTNATQASVNLPEEVLCTAAVGSASNTCREIGYVRADFDDTGGAAEDLWAIQTGINDVVTGKTADGIIQPYNPTFSGVSADPTISLANWFQINNNIHIFVMLSASGTSNSAAFLITAPSKAKISTEAPTTQVVNNGVNVTTPGLAITNTGSTSINLYLDTSPAGTGWTAANGKRSNLNMSYIVGPAASFIE